MLWPQVRRFDFDGDDQAAPMRSLMGASPSRDRGLPERGHAGPLARGAYLSDRARGVLRAQLAACLCRRAL